MEEEKNKDKEEAIIKGNESALSKHILAYEAHNSAFVPIADIMPGANNLPQAVLHGRRASTPIANDTASPLMRLVDLTDEAQKASKYCEGLREAVLNMALPEEERNRIFFENVQIPHFANLDNDQQKVAVAALCVSLNKVFKRPFSRNGLSAQNFRVCCGYQKEGCQFNMFINQSGKIELKKPHTCAEVNKPTSEAMRDAREFKMSIPTKVYAELVEKAKTYNKQYTKKPSQRRADLRNDLILLMKAEGKEILHNYPIPDQVLTQILELAEKAEGKGASTSPSESLQRLIKSLEAEKTPYTIMRDEEESIVTSSSSKRITSGIFWNVHTVKPEEILLLMSDVTFNLMDASSGFNKSSSYCVVTPGHSMTMITCGVILREDKRTFIKELQHLIENVDPTLPDREVIIIVDHDRGKLAAIIELLPLAVIFLCLWHKEENWETHIGAALRSAATALGGKKLTTVELKANLKRENLPQTGNLTILQERWDKHLKSKAVLSAIDDVNASGAAQLVKVTDDNNAARKQEEQEEVDVAGLASLTSLSTISAALLKDGEEIVQPVPSKESEEEARKESEEEPKSLEMKQVEQLEQVEQVDESIQGKKKAIVLPKLDEAQQEMLAEAKKSWNKHTTRPIWKFLQSAHSEADANGKISVLIHYLKGSGSNVGDNVLYYLNNEVRRTIPYWARYARAWKMTYFLVATSLQENVHATLKVMPFSLFDNKILTLRKKSELKTRIPLEDLPQYVRDKMEKRTIASDLRNIKASEKGVLEEAMGKEVMKSFILFKPEIKKLISEAHHKSLSFQCNSCSIEEAKQACEMLKKKDVSLSASANRMKILLEEYAEVCCFKFATINSSNALSHIAVIDQVSGSCACSCAAFAEYGLALVDPHILLLFTSRKIAVNAYLMSHPIHLFEEYRCISKEVCLILFCFIFQRKLIFAEKNK